MVNSQACLLALTMGRVSIAFSQVLVDSFSSSHLHAYQDTFKSHVCTANQQAKSSRITVRQSIAWQLPCCSCRTKHAP